jgi:hypothetical protein
LTAFDLIYAPVQRTGRPQSGLPARSPAPCIFARYTPAQKLILNFFAFGELCEALPVFLGYSKVRTCALPNDNV